MGAIRDFIDFMKDAFAITGTALTSKWLWLMVGFGVYFVLQAWLMLAISPLTLLVMPGCLIVYLLWDEHRRIKPLLKKPQVETINWNVSANVDNYIKTLTKAQILEEDRKKDYEQ
jgi:predicted tellurium resistance membrane protein TerC